MKHFSDTRYAELFSHPYFVKGLLTHFVDEQFIADLDFSDMEPCKSSFVTETYAKRESDVIWRIRFRGNDVYLFLLIEFQSTVDRSMPFRLMRYIAELYASFTGTKEQGRSRSQDKTRYPPVFPIVLYNGDRPWRAEKNISDLIEPLIPPEYIPRFRYYLIEERSFSPETLSGIRNLVALLFLTESLPPEKIALSIDAFFDILKTEDGNAVALFGRWINDYLRQVAASDVDVPYAEFRTGEDPSMLAENLRQWRNKNIEEGRQEGRKEVVMVARRLLQRGLSLAEVTDLTRLSPEEIAKVSAEGSSTGGLPVSS